MEALEFNDVVFSLLAQNTPVRFRAPGASMESVIPDGSLLTLAPIRAARVEIGDVVAARIGDRLVVHRCVARTADALLLRGDAVPATSQGEWVGPDDVFGKVVAIERLRALATRWRRRARRFLRMAIRRLPISARRAT